MGCKPPNWPRNPYWLPPFATRGVEGPVGIADAYWESSINEWLEDHTAFLHAHHNAQGQPADGSFHAIWNQVRAVQDFYARVPAGSHVANPPIADRARKALRDVVLDTGHIENAVCLGLGGINWRSKVDYKREWIQQCGMFLAICQLLEQKQGMQPGSLSKIFQDPLFKIEEQYILHTVGRQRIVEMPAANDLMDQTTFVFAPHLTGPAMFDTFLTPGREPGLLYTNTFHGTLGPLAFAIVKANLTEIILSGNPNANAAADNLFRMAERFVNRHRGIAFHLDFTENPIVQRAFYASSFYIPKPELVVP